MFEKIKLKKTKEELLKGLDLDHIENPDWDEDTFIESYSELKEKLVKSKNREVTLVKFFEDGLFVKKGCDCSEYEDEFSMAPFKRISYAKGVRQPVTFKEIKARKDIVVDNVSRLTFEDKIGLSSDQDLEIVYYGPTKVFNIQPGQFIFISKKDFSENDIIGSNEFTGCSVISFKTSEGYFFAHIKTDILGVRELLNKLKQELNSDLEINLVRPEWKENGAIREDYEKYWRELESEFPNLKIAKYAYIAMNSDRPENINDTSVLMTREKLMTIGTNFYPGKKREFNYDTLKCSSL